MSGGPDERGDAIGRLASALSEGHATMLRATAKAAPDKEAFGGLMSWALHTFGPESLRATETYNALAFLGPPWLNPSTGANIDMPAWAEWQQKLQNELDAYADAGVGQYTEATYERLDRWRVAFNEWAPKFRQAGLAVMDVAAVELPAVVPDLPAVVPAGAGKMLALGLGATLAALVGGVFIARRGKRRSK